MDKFNVWFKYAFLAAIGGGMYYAIEMLWRGRSHWSMFLLGGIVFVYAGIQNEYTDWDYPFWKQTLHTWVFAIVSEFNTGCIVNLWLGLNVWDYSNLPGNIMGQICWQFALLFLPLCAFAIVLDDYVRWIVFGEEIPHYKII